MCVRIYYVHIFIYWILQSNLDTSTFPSKLWTKRSLIQEPLLERRMLTVTLGQKTHNWQKSYPRANKITNTLWTTSTPAQKLCVHCVLQGVIHEQALFDTELVGQNSGREYTFLVQTMNQKIFGSLLKRQMLILTLEKDTYLSETLSCREQN